MPGEKSMSRLEIKYSNKSKNFRVSNFEFDKQFNHIYKYRLKDSAEFLREAIKKKWGSKYKIQILNDLKDHERCVIIGTVFKKQELKPSVLKEISEQSQLNPQPPRSNFCDKESDVVILEDESQRVQLEGNMDNSKLTTGVICSALGVMKTGGKFFVEEFLYFESGPQRSLKPLSNNTLVVFLYGLDHVLINDHSLSLELFQQWLTGNIQGASTEDGQIVRLIICGNVVRSENEHKVSSLFVRKTESPTTVTAIKALDKVFSMWAESIEIDLMPGIYDPTNFMLPQQPFHHCLFPESRKLSSFHCVTNPYQFEMEDRLVLGCSGQNLQSVMKITNIEDTMDALKGTLEWSHLSPTCPDSLACFPYLDKDPFVIKECPHIYFAGNHTDGELKTEMWTGNNGDKKTRLICVPSFSKTQSVAVVNLNTLDCTKVSFKIE
ncbi:POLD2 family protein [Megaselia abdita]